MSTTSLRRPVKPARRINVSVKQPKSPNSGAFNPHRRFMRLPPRRELGGGGV